VEVRSTAAASTPTALARLSLTEARECHGDGRDEEAVDILVEWLDAYPTSQDAELRELLQAMVALGCWLCNNLATRHLFARRVARAFGYTTTCERWLCLREVPVNHSKDAEMWARLQYDCALNAAELAQSSGDRLKAVALLRECERLQASAPSLPDPEAAHLCLAEVLLESGRNAEAATAAVRAMQILRKQPVEDEERKVYGLLFALSLEQAALAAAGTAGMGPPPIRALRCLPDAEAVWSLAKHSESEEGGTPGSDASRVLLGEMRTVHGRLLQQAAKAHSEAHEAHSKSPEAKRAHRLPAAGATIKIAPKEMNRPGTSPSKPCEAASRKAAEKRQKHIPEEMRRLQNQLRTSTEALEPNQTQKPSQETKEIQKCLQKQFQDSLYRRTDGPIIVDMAGKDTFKDRFRKSVGRASAAELEFGLQDIKRHQQFVASNGLPTRLSLHRGTTDSFAATAPAARPRAFTEP